MLQRDYIMRLLQQFVEALEKLIEQRETKEGPTFQLELQSLYRAYFNRSPEFYYTHDAEFILMDACKEYGESEYLIRIDMLSELIYQDALLKSGEEQKYLLSKSLYLLTHLDKHSNTFSFERRDKINNIKNKISS